MSKTCCYRIIIVMLIAILFIILLAKPGSRVLADVGLPPVRPSGSSLSPEAEFQTNVRMMMEEVNLTVEPYERPIPSGGDDIPGYWMRVLVDARFVMRNLSDEPEAFDAWFPLAATTRYPDMLIYETSRHPENIIQDFRVRVDGQPVATRQVIGPALNLPEGESSWATFPVVFPPGQDVVIRVRYTLYPGGRRPFGDIDYILQTGAGWAGTIGKGTVTVHLPDKVTLENVSQSETIHDEFPLHPQPPGYVIEDNTITWHFSELEPTAEDNIFLNVLEPQRYQRLLQARRKVAQADASAAATAYIELARAIRESVLIIKTVAKNGGGSALGDEATAAYENALQLNPDEPSVYSEYARWLMIVEQGWMQLEFQGTCPEEVCELVERGLQRFPQDAGLLELDASFKESWRMHQTEEANATQDAIMTVTQQALETLAARPSRTSLSAVLTRTALAIALQHVEQTQVAPSTKAPIPRNTSIPASATVQVTMAEFAQSQPNSTTARDNVSCSAGLTPLLIVGVLVGVDYYRRRR